MSDIGMSEAKNKEITDFLEKLDIKMARKGGFEQEDVYSKMQDLCDIYEKRIEKMEDYYEDRLSQSGGNDEALLKENEELRARVKKHDEDSKIFTNLMIDAKRNSEARLEEANAEAEKIIAEANKKAGETILESQNQSEQILTETQQKAEELMRENTEALEKRAAEQEEALDILRQENAKYVQYIESLEGGIQQIKANLEEIKGKFSVVMTEKSEMEESVDTASREEDATGAGYTPNYSTEDTSETTESADNAEGKAYGFTAAAGGTYE